MKVNPSSPQKREAVQGVHPLPPIPDYFFTIIQNALEGERGGITTKTGIREL
jgi:hypothetical protein